MYYILWEDNGQKRWESCESRREVAALIIREKLESDDSVVIFGPDAEDNIIDQETIFANL